MGVSAAIDLILALIDRASAISALIAKAKAEGRDKLTAEEWTSVKDAADAARQRLVDAIK